MSWALNINRLILIPYNSDFLLTTTSFIPSWIMINEMGVSSHKGFEAFSFRPYILRDNKLLSFLVREVFALKCKLIAYDIAPMRKGCLGHFSVNREITSQRCDVSFCRLGVCNVSAFFLTTFYFMTSFLYFDVILYYSLLFWYNNLIYVFVIIHRFCIYLLNTIVQGNTQKLDGFLNVGLFIRYHVIFVRKYKTFQKINIPRQVL